jgi:hypothetical protein
MPVYDGVLAARLLAGGPAAEAQLAIATANDADMSARDRSRELDRLRAIAGAHAELVIEGEEGERYLLVIENAEETTFDITDSRSATEDLPARGTPYAHAPTKVPADEVIELLGHEEAERLDDHEVRLPYHWPDREAMMNDLAKIGPLLDAVLLVVEIEDRRYDVEVAYGGVTCTPLHLRSTASPTILDALLPDLAVVDSPITVPFAAATKRAPATKVDPARPLTTGSARERLHAFQAHTEARKNTAPTIAPLIAAVRDEANRDERFAELRRQIYHYLAKLDRPEVCALWLWALHEESDEVAKTVTYIGWRLESVIAKLPDELRAAEARGDQRTVGRIKRLQAEAR